MTLELLGGVVVTLLLGAWARLIHEHTHQYWDAKGPFVKKEAEDMSFITTVVCVIFAFGVGDLMHQVGFVTAIAFITGAVGTHYIEKRRMRKIRRAAI